MSCGLSCSGQPSHVEFFSDSPYVPAPQAAVSSCDGKIKSCQYTTQGELVCGMPITQQPQQTGTPLYEGFFQQQSKWQTKKQ